MGHLRTDPLPQTRKWNDIVGMMVAGAGVPQLATATLTAVETRLRAAPDDVGVVESVWLLVRLPIAARRDDFTLALGRCGVTIPSGGGLLDLVAGVSDAIDVRLANNKGRTDMGEMAQTSVAETLVHVANPRLTNLFDSTPDDVRKALAGLATVKQFGLYARDYFARFVRKCLGYFLSRALPDMTGSRLRFGNVAEQSRFTNALEVHCREASGIVEEVASQWFSKHNHLTAGAIGRETTSKFVAGAVNKLIDELKLRTGGHGH